MLTDGCLYVPRLPVSGILSLETTQVVNEELPLTRWEGSYDRRPEPTIRA